MGSSGLRHLLERYTKSLEDDPDNPKTRVEVAEILEELGETGEATEQYATAARLFVNTGLYQEAAATCRRVLNLIPAHPEAQRILAGLRQRGLVPDEPSVPTAESAAVGPAQPTLPAPMTAPPTAVAAATPSGAPPQQVVVLDSNAGSTDLTMESPLPTARGSDGAPPRPVSTAALVTGPVRSVPASGDARGAADLAAQQPLPPAAGDEISTANAADVSGDRAKESRPTPARKSDRAAKVAAKENRTAIDTGSAESLLPLLSPSVATSGIQQHFSGGQAIVTQGEPSEELFVVVEGRAQASHAHSEGALELDVFEAGGFFGELALLGDGRHPTTVRALEDCTLLVVPKSHVKRLFQESPSAERIVRRAYRDRLINMALLTSPLFATLHGRVAKRLLRKCQPIKVAADRPVISEGDVAPGLFLVLLGDLAVSVKRPEGSESVELGTLTHGDFFGEISLLRDKPCTATVCSRSFCQLLHLPADDFFRFAEQRPSFKAALDKEARRREREMLQRLGQ